MKKLVESGIAHADIGSRFGCHKSTVAKMARVHGWHVPYAERCGYKKKGRYPKAESSEISRLRRGRRPKKPPKVSGKSNLSIDRDMRVDNENADRERYGDLLAEVKFLRTRGWPIFRDEGGVRVGNILADSTTLLEIARRERRILGAHQ